MADALEILIVGAGFGGPGMRLRQAGRTNFMMLEKEAGDGRITTQWPGSTLELRCRTRRVDLAAVDTVHA